MLVLRLMAVTEMTSAPSRDSAAPPSAREGFIRIRGMRLRVSVQGEGPPLLLINGLGANIEMWVPLRRRLSGRQTIAFDAPGVGGSDRSPVRLRMHDLADILNDLLDALGYPIVDVLGYSLGGAVAQEFAHQHPHRVRRLVLAATTPGMGAIQNPMTVMTLFTLPLRRNRAEAHRRAFARVVGGHAGREAAALAVVKSAYRANPTGNDGLARQMFSMAGWTSLRWLHTIRAPTLLLAGEDDRLVPPINNRIFMSRIPDCSQVVIPRGGHLFLIDQPEDAVRALGEFLRGEQGWATAQPAAVAPESTPASASLRAAVGGA